jgi:hypothetical protein
VLLVGALSACATIRQVSALKQVAFAIEGVRGIRLAGVPLDHVRSASDVSTFDAARIAAAVLSRHVPLEFDIHVNGDNPADNATTARLVRLQWTLDLNGRETVSGIIDTAYTFVPGITTDVRVPIRLDLAQFYQNSAQDALDLALGLAGLGTRQTEVVIRAVPSIDTPLGAIKYPSPITIVRKTVGP